MTDDAPDPEATVLVLDDEDTVRAVVRKLLEREGYRVLVAATAHEALGVIERHADEVDLLVCDLVLPGLGGREAANTLIARAPDLKVLFMSGYSSAGSGRRDVQKGGEHFIGKPFDSGELIEAVRTALAD